VLTPDQKQRWRELILSELYDRTDGDPLNGPTPSEILEGVYGRLGYPFVDEQPEPEIAERVEQELGEAKGPEVDRQIEYLEGEGLLRWEGQQIVLTHEGVRHVEERAGSEAAAVLPAIVVRDVEAFLTEVQLKRDDLGLSPEDEQTLEAYLQSVTAQITSPKPNRGIVRAAVGAIGWFVRDAAASAAGTALFLGASQLLGKI